MDTRCIQLLGRKLAGEATPEELAELDLLLVRHPEAMYYAELIGQLWEEEMARNPSTGERLQLDASYLKHLTRHRPGFRDGTEGQRPAPLPWEAEPTTRHHPKKKLLLAGACVLVLAAAVTGGLFYFRSQRSRQQEAYARRTDSNAEFFTKPGARQTIILPDGTRVRLNSGSRLSYDSNMLSKDTRTVTLSGEAFFDVAKDKDRGFVVHTDKIEIKVLGTAFNVKAYLHDKITETTLLRGSIELAVNNKPYQKIILKPKEKFALVDDPQEALPPVTAGQLRPRNTSIAPAPMKEKLIIQDIQPVEVEDKEYVKEVSWVDDNFVFRNETLEDLIPGLERWFNVSIEIKNRSIRNYHFTGVFHKETIDEALTALQFIKPFTFKITDHHVLIN
jgi:transmembrane sensor